jgi:hypothetical protein
VCQGEERLYFLRHIGEGSRNAGLQLSCCLRTVAPSEFVFTGRQDEGLFGAKAPFLCGGPHAVSKLLAWEEQIPLGSLLNHWITSILVILGTSLKDRRIRVKRLLLRRLHFYRFPYDIQSFVFTDNPRRTADFFRSDPIVPSGVVDAHRDLAESALHWAREHKVRRILCTRRKS